MQKNIQRIEDKYTELLELQNEVEEYILKVSAENGKKTPKMPQDHKKKQQ